MHLIKLTVNTAISGISCTVKRPLGPFCSFNESKLKQVIHLVDRHARDSPEPFCFGSHLYSFVRGGVRSLDTSILKLTGDSDGASNLFWNYTMAAI